MIKFKNSKFFEDYDWIFRIYVLLKNKSIKSKFIILIICISIIFISRNTFRLNKEYTNYNYNFFKDFKYNVEKSYFRINEKC